VVTVKRPPSTTPSSRPRQFIMFPWTTFPIRTRHPTQRARTFSDTRLSLQRQSLCIYDRSCHHMSVSLPRQYVLHVVKGGYGPTLQHTTPTPSLARLTPAETNMNYCLSPYLELGLMFSRGAFLTQVTQTGPSEKTLFPVSLYKHKRVQHQTGVSYDAIFANLASSQWIQSGEQFRMKWGVTYTLAYEDPTVADDLVHVKANLYDAPGEDPQAPDSPPAFGPHNGDPVNFYGTTPRLAAMSGMLCRCQNCLYKDRYMKDRFNTHARPKLHPTSGTEHAM